MKPKHTNLIVFFVLFISLLFQIFHNLSSQRSVKQSIHKNTKGAYLLSEAKRNHVLSVKLFGKRSEIVTLPVGPSYEVIF